MQKWIGIDFDGTLATGHNFGPPVPLMIQRVQAWLAAGQPLRIFTARAAFPDQCLQIHAWLVENGLPCLPITQCKDVDLIEIWDDRAIQIERDTGRRIDEIPFCADVSERNQEP